MNRKIRQLAFGLMALFVLLFGGINYWQVGMASDLNARDGNTRSIRRDYSRARGEIVTRDGVVVAMSVPAGEGSEFPWQRVYPEDDLYANVTGYYTLALGSTQLERTQNDVLTGQTARQRIGNLEDIVSGGDGTGNVVLTIDSRLQRRARDLLVDNGYFGSISMIDVQTGAVLAMYSNPSYDPNLLVQPDFGAARDARALLLEADGNPLLANAYQQRFMPGSTFKVITTGIGLESGLITLDSTWPDETEWTPPQTSRPIRNYNGTSCGGDLPEVFRRSCNIPFAQISIDVGIDGMRAGTEAWGIGQPIPIDLPRPAASTFGSFDELPQNLPWLAMRGFGQQDDQMVPLHMAMVAATVGNNGVMMKPYVVYATTDSQGDALAYTDADEWLQPISADTAGELNLMMQQVATNGTAQCCLRLDNGVSVAAKTGTAQLNSDGQPERSHAWIIAFAPAEAPRYAISVVILGTTDEISASTGGKLAGPLARRMLNEALEIGL